MKKNAPYYPDPVNLQIANKFFWLFIFFHTLLWTIGPALTRPSLPHDTLESISWGLQWQWGYNKHPFLAAWLTAGMFRLFDSLSWPVYLLAQLAVSTTFISVWRLGLKILTPIHAIIAALALDGVLFYNINSCNFTPDTLQSPLWALLTLFVYLALTTQRLRYWVLSAILAAACLMTKYQAVLLFLPMLLFVLSNPLARRSFSKPGPWIALGLILLFISPHVYWLWQHDFISLRYAIGTGTESTAAPSHLINPLEFLLGALGLIIGLFIIFWPFYRGEKTNLNLSPFDWQYLLCVGTGPLILTLLLSLITGEYYPLRWATPYFFLSGILLMASLKPQVTARQFKQFIVSLVLLSSLIWGIRIGLSVFHPRIKSDAYLPNQVIASTLTKLWHQHYPSQLPYLAGSHYLVATVAPYSKDKPVPYFSWSHRQSPWVNERDLLEKGGLFIWDIDKQYTWDADSERVHDLPQRVRDRYPQLELFKTYTFYRVTNGEHPLRIGVALLRPAHISPNNGFTLK